MSCRCIARKGSAAPKPRTAARLRPAAAILAAALFPAALGAAPAKTGKIDFTGSVDALATAAALNDYAGGSTYAFGFEQYANLRLKARIGERGTLYAAANLIAAAGTPVLTAAAQEAAGLGESSFAVGKNYAAAFEAERLYFRIESDAFDVETGLMRLAFGYGQAWSPSDFLSPRNPLLPDARPRGVLAVAATAYPSDAWKLKTFFAAPEDALASDLSGSFIGASADLHTDRASFQAIYAWEVSEPKNSVHRIGFSTKLEAEVGIAVDLLYALDGAVLSSGDYYDEKWNGFQGLKASAGFDYTLLKGDLYVLFQYLYNGGGALDPGEEVGALYAAGSAWYDAAPAGRTIKAGIPYGELNRKNYLYGALTYRFDDYTNATIDCVSSLDDASFSPSLTLSHEPFQGLAVSLSCRAPLDARTFSSDGGYGELGPTMTGTRLLVSAKAKAKF